MSVLEFKPSKPLTMGVELELQVVDRRSSDLTRGASDIIALLARRGAPGDARHEITESMLEVSSTPHDRYQPLKDELIAIRDAVVDAADRVNLLVAGGGAHPFQHWPERIVTDRPRYQKLAEIYGYLAKHVTIFGQHVHIGCEQGDIALYLLHALSRYIPHFLALAASSPYYQGVDTGFHSARLNAMAPYPTSGFAPYIVTWDAFEAYYGRLKTAGVIESMKDLYWDIRPKPEYGTVEVRVFDTPLTVERAAALGVYVQVLCRRLLAEPPNWDPRETYLVYQYNRFQACRFGLDGDFVDPETHVHRSIREDVIATIGLLAADARELEATEPIAAIEHWARERDNDARWLRERYAESQSFEDLVWHQARRWRGQEHS
ncbi:MAG: YbdK family carboxylate-amine ligase [Casimicrobiaceae bacterium]